MIDCGYVTGNKEQAVELIVGIDTVYVHDDIQLLKKEDEHGNQIELYKYHEIQYDKDEFISLMANENQSLQETAQMLTTCIMEIGQVVYGD